MIGIACGAGSRVVLDLEGTAHVSLAALVAAFGAVPGVEDVAVHVGPAELNS